MPHDEQYVISLSTLSAKHTVHSMFNVQVSYSLSTNQLFVIFLRL